MNDLLNSKPVNNNVNQTNNNNSSTPSIFDFVNSNNQSAPVNTVNSNPTSNQDKKSFGFLKKKNNAAEETNISTTNKAVVNTTNSTNTITNNDNPDLFSLTGDANQAPVHRPAADNAEKNGFRFIKSTVKNKEQTNGSSINNAISNEVNFSNNSAVAENKNEKYDLLNEIYSQSIGESSNKNNVNVDNKNYNILTENLNNLNLNNQNPNNFNAYNNNNNNGFGGLNYNNNNYNKLSFTKRK